MNALDCSNTVVVTGKGGLKIAVLSYGLLWVELDQ